MSLDSQKEYNLASLDKVLHHKGKLDDYHNGGIIYPVTLEFYPENACNARCAGCPTPGRTENARLDFSTIEKLFRDVAGKTRGIYISGGGEPTLHPQFPDILQCARDSGFEDVVMITNGTQLERPEIQNAILRYADSVRVSLNSVDNDGHKRVYGMSFGTFDQVCRGIRSLREKRDSTGSKTQIGIATLTNGRMTKEVGPFYDLGVNMGVDWIHYRPWINGFRKGEIKGLRIVDTDEERIALAKLPKSEKPKVVISHDRYRLRSEELRFQQYHYSHFLAVIGADGEVYPSDELADFPAYSLGNLRNFTTFEDFLYSPGRVKIIQSISHENHPRLGARTRGPLYSHRIEQIISEGEIIVPENIHKITHPHIL